MFHNPILEVTHCYFCCMLLDKQTNPGIVLQCEGEPQRLRIPGDYWGLSWDLWGEKSSRRYSWERAIMAWGQKFGRWQYVEFTKLWNLGLELSLPTSLRVTQTQIAIWNIHVIGQKPFAAYWGKIGRSERTFLRIVSFSTYGPNRRIMYRLCVMKSRPGRKVTTDFVLKIPPLLIYGWEGSRHTSRRSMCSSCSCNFMSSVLKWAKNVYLLITEGKNTSCGHYRWRETEPQFKDEWFSPILLSNPSGCHPQDQRFLLSLK